MLRTLALVISGITGVLVVFTRTAFVTSWGAYALELSLGLLGGLVLVTAALRLWALRGDPGRRRRFSMYALPEAAVVLAFGLHDMAYRQADLVLLMGGVVLLVDALTIGQLWLLMPGRRTTARPDRRAQLRRASGHSAPTPTAH